MVAVRKDTHLSGVRLPAVYKRVLLLVTFHAAFLNTGIMIEVLLVIGCAYLGYRMYRKPGDKFLDI